MPRDSASVILEKIEANQGKENGRPASQHPNGAPPSGQNWPLLQPESEALGSHHLWQPGSHEYGGQELQTPGKGHWLSSSSPQEQLPILTPQSTILTQPGWKPPVSPRAQLTEIQQEEAERRRMEEKNPFGATSQAMLSASPESSIGFRPQTSPSSSPKFYVQFQDEDAYKAASLNAPSGAGANFQGHPSSARQGDIPAWVSSLSSEKESSPRELGDELLESTQNKRVTEVNLNKFNQPFAPQLSQKTVILNDGDFVQLKESKKNKKRFAKVKALAPNGAFTSIGEPPLPNTSLMASHLGPLEVSEESFSSHSSEPLLAEVSEFQEPTNTAWSVNPSGQPKTPMSLTEIQKGKKQASQEQEQLPISQAGNMQQGIQASLQPVVLMSQSVSGGASAWQTLPSQQPMSAPHSKTVVFGDDADGSFWDTNFDRRRNLGASKHVLKPEW
ncbi:unnamed protein product [Sphagnum troendelagicum]|uniref:Uncharacterized protein n=1 Tax=Sphagnum troendelagicum TaxID=128251 RepID=A0ABP0TS29_9BRYO